MKTYLLDLDGTMYHGSKIIEEAKIFVNYLLENNIEFYFLTNNATRTKAQNVKHMLDMGYEGIKEEHFYTSAMAAASYVKQHYEGNKVFVIGEDGLKEALLEAGFEFADDNVDFVFVGLDKQANYQKYSEGLKHLLKGAKLVGTNYDRVIATAHGYEVGNGAIVDMLEYASGQTSMKIGKPYAPILEGCLNYIHKEKDEVVIVGDNLETDIKLGVNHGVESILVLSGVHREEDIKKLGIKPDKMITSLMEFIKK